MTHLTCPRCSRTALILSTFTQGLHHVVALACDHFIVFENKRHSRRWTGLLWCWGCDSTCQPHDINELSGLCRSCDTAPLTSASERSPVVSKPQGNHGMSIITKDGQTVTPASKKEDDAAVASALASMTAHVVGPQTSYDQPITYVTAKNGLMEVRDSDLIRVVTKATSIVGVTDDLLEGITLKIPKIPFALLAQTVAFFRAACQKFKGSSEALVQIWWHREERRHELHVPDQTVSGGSVRHESKFDQANDGIWVHLMDIHSHGSSMSAFWSGGDDNDERRTNGERMFGVIGRVDDPLPEWKWRLRTAGRFMDLAITDIVDFSDLKFDFHVDGNILIKAAAEPGKYKNGWVDLLCPVDPFKGVECPAEWLDKVSAHSYHQSTPVSHSGGHGAYYEHARGGNIPPGYRRFVYIGMDEHEVVDGNHLNRTGVRIGHE